MEDAVVLQRIELAQQEDRYLRSPRVRDGHLELSVWLTDEGREAWARFDEEALRASDPWSQVRWLDADVVPAMERERSFRAEDACVDVESDDGVASVWLTRGDTRVLVWRACGMAAAPTLLAASGGTLVAFHHNVREDDGRADIAKWIALRFVDDAGRVHEPAAPMVDRDRDRHGEEQSFEFPELVLGHDGALAIYGRGSHDFYRQTLDASGFSPRHSLSSGGWGSRGRRCAAGRVGAKVLSARRERRAVVVEWHALPRGGAPKWAPVEVDATCSTGAFMGDAPRFDERTFDGRATFFGDIQQHSAHSDGTGSADEVYLRARDGYDDDFVALTDHESFLGKRTSPGEWEYLKRVADHYDEPGRFTTLLAYEWTGRMYPGPGHKCVYVPERDAPVLSRDDYPEGRDFIAAAKERSYLAAPHHIGWTGCDEEGHDPQVQTTWEICSCHGCYEHPNHPLGMRGEHDDQLVSAMLAKGHRFGFTASSDSHGLLWHHGESRKRDPYRTGLTAVQTEELSRNAVLEALRTRRCYATSGAKIWLDLEARSGERRWPMGSEIRRDEHEGIEIVAHARGNEPLSRIELVGAEGVLVGAEGQGPSATLTSDFEGPGFVYLRVVQSDGEYAWSSPIFVD